MSMSFLHKKDMKWPNSQVFMRVNGRAINFSNLSFDEKIEQICESACHLDQFLELESFSVWKPLRLW